MNGLLISQGAIVGIVVAVIVVVLLIAVVGWWISTNNALVRLKNKVEEAWATIDVYLKKRFDLIPNLVNTVKGYVKHENDTFSQITTLRGEAVNTNNMNHVIETNNKISGSLRNMLALTENYPTLKADKHFLSLQNSLNDIEKHISEARIKYNDQANIYNTKLETFPNNLIAAIFKFEKSSLFVIADPKERENVIVEF